MIRRALSAIVAAALLLPQPGLAQIATGYRPQSSDERGLWMVMEEEERKTRASHFLIRDEALNAYVREVFCKTVGEQCRDVRIYILRTPYFNASMAPNGMMQLWSGMFLRTRDEAQLAAVLAHEFVHYREQHSLRIFRDVRNKTGVMSFLSIPLAVFGGYGAATLAQFAMLASIFGFSRDQERAADAGSVALLADAGYDPMSAARIWHQILVEREATASERKRRPRGDDALFGTHPTSKERMGDLQALAGQQGGGGGDVGRDRYMAALAPFRAGLIDDQIKLNDFGGTELLLANLAAEGWTPDLLHARGELYRSRGRPDDLAAAAGFYRGALAAGGAPAEARRGLGLVLLRSGDAEAGRAALRAYLAAKPDADDRAMIEMLSTG